MSDNDVELLRHITDPEASRAMLREMVPQLIARGRMIDAGFVSLRTSTSLGTAPSDQMALMRMAFFAGANHLFMGMATILNGQNVEVGERQLQAVGLELARFMQELEALDMPAQGSA
jgi:hypothetical protein